MISLIFLYATAACITAQSTGPSVVTSQGTVIGAYANDGSYFVFYGIPYAGFVSGADRFKPPPPAPTFPGDFHASDSSKVCVQPGTNGVVGEENCLVLNIFTQNLTTPKPVIVYIDGEEYTTTTTNNQLYTYRNLVERDVVVVTINYRLSVFGFLCLGVEQAPGNAGLKDIIAGLRWIQQNIAGFGGNPDNVVLFGHGSGAAMVDLITLSPQSSNLIHKAIVSSGSALAPWAVAYDPVGSAESLGARLGYTDKTREELATALAETDLSVLITVLREYESYNNTAYFAPCIEDSRLNNTVLTDAPINILRSSNYSRIPYLTGYVNREGTVRAQQALHGNWLAAMQYNFSNFLQVDMGFPNFTTRTAVAQNISNFYFGTAIINLASIEDFLDYHGDSMFLVSIIRNVKERVALSSEIVWLYEFAYRGTYNNEFPYNIPLTGAKHGDVRNFLFNYDLRLTDLSFSQSLVTRWVTFANNGNPNPLPPATQLVNWPAATVNNVAYLYYTGGEQSPNITIGYESGASNPHSQRMTFWTDLYDRYYVPPPMVSAGDKILSFALAILVCQVIVSFVSQ